MCVCVCVYVCIYIYIYIYIHIEREGENERLCISSCRVYSMDLSDPLLPLVSIAHRLQQVLCRHGTACSSM